MLMVRFIAQNAERDKIIFDLLKRGQCRLSVVRNSLIVACVRLLRERTPSARIEDGLRQRWPQRPQKTCRVEEVSKRRSLEADRTAQRYGRVERCTRNADAIVRLRNAPLRRSDIRATFQQLRRKSC